MVYLNSQKFACESCIKGHRSSSCHHTDRPLFEIKRKGRPVSQCTNCRELRKSKKLHSKCTCTHKEHCPPAVQPLASGSGSKTKRFIPIVPALPNGLRDALSSPTRMDPPDSRQKVDTLLNPCDCKSVWKCQCRSNTEATQTNPLSTLAQAAASLQQNTQSCCSPLASSPSASSSVSRVSSSKGSSRSSRPGSPTCRPRKRARQEKAAAPAVVELPPIRSTPVPSSEPSMPDFGTFVAPPLSQITSLAGSGCTCGVRCACPGCVEHRGSDHADHDKSDCTSGCGTCVDNNMGMGLPVSDSAQSSTPNNNFLDRFFARAAALPLPPDHRKTSSYHLNPMNTTLYPNNALQQGSQSLAFGLVNVPKICCGGQCNCPSGRCECQTSCAGCCASDDVEDSPPVLQEIAPVRSCCAGKV